MSYLQNYLGKKLSDFNESEIKKIITNELLSVFEYTNRVPVNKLSIINNFIDDLKQFKHLTIEEVKQALNNGKKGLYGDIADISNTVLYKWINLYLNNSDRLNDINLYNIRHSIVEVKLSDAEIEQKDIDCLQKLFKELKNKKIDKIIDFRGMWYNLLIKYNHDLINFENFIEEAKKILIDENNQKKIKSLHDLKGIKQIIDSINNDKENLMVIYKAKELSVNEYFSNLEILIIK